MNDVVWVNDEVLIGTARCSEAESQCTDVYARPDGSRMLVAASGERLVVPAAEVAEVARLLTT